MRFWKADLPVADAFIEVFDIHMEQWWHQVLEELRAEAPVPETTVLTRTQLRNGVLLVMIAVMLSIFRHHTRQVSRI